MAFLEGAAKAGADALGDDLAAAVRDAVATAKGLLERGFETKIILPAEDVICPHCGQIAKPAKPTVIGFNVAVQP